MIPQAIINDDGIPCIVGDRSQELQEEIRRIAADMVPQGEGLGMGFRAWSLIDLQVMLEIAKANLSPSNVQGQTTPTAPKP